MNKIKCSVPILTLNSGKYLARCLESVEDFDDVFLVDGNSTDDTLEIAKRYNVSVYKQVETEKRNIVINNFTEIRVKSAKLAKNDWILVLDSDEYLTQDLVKEIRETVGCWGEKNNRIFRIQKKYCIGDKIYDYAFNYPNYYFRLYNKSGGANFGAGKIVHEKIRVPDDVEIIDLKNWLSSETSKSFLSAIVKDKHQLALMKKSTFASGAFKSRGHSLKMSVVYFLRAVKILLKSLLVYVKHGYAKSLPFGQVLRHVRVHLIVSYWRFLQFIFGGKYNQ